MTRLIFAFLGLSLFGSTITEQGVESCGIFDQTDCKPCLRPQSGPNKRVENRSPNVVGLELDKLEIRLPSPEGSPPRYPSYSSELSIKVKTTSEDFEGDPSITGYVVTGGRVVGTGANVTWDLNGVWPGTYTITAAVDDGCGKCGAKLTKTITILPAKNAPRCVCSEIRIDSLNEKIESRVPVFSAYISGSLPPEVGYNWTVSPGTVEAGQGTRTVKLRPPETRDETVTISLQVSGLDPSCDCQRTASRNFKY